MFRSLCLKCVLVPALLVAMAATAHANVTLETDGFAVEVDARGQVVGLIDKARAVNHVAADQDSPLLQMRVDGAFHGPDRMAWDADRQQMTLHYGPVRAVIQSQVKPTHINFELIEVEPMEAVDRVQWGPIATQINAVVGNTIGVVRDDVFAVGLQILNVKTQGGVSRNEEGRSVSRGTTAVATDWGSTLQAYSIDRSRPRNITVWGAHYPNMPIEPIPGETVIGSRIALFGCAAEQALARVGEIGLAEGLPRFVFDGKWSRTDPQMGRPYIVIEFTEQNIHEVLAFAKRGGFHSVYHPHPFKSWGHYQLRSDHFPSGVEGMKACVKAAAEAGIRIGVHTLTNFINTSDPYITPVPDPRLAKTGSSTIVADIDAEQTEIEIADPEYFNNNEANWLRTVMIGEELIRYGRVSDAPPWKLLDCRRGAWGTRASSHEAGGEIGKLMDHPYQVFFPSYEMQHDIALRLSELFNETGISHMDFDGHEGCWATGQGTFAVDMFAKVFHDNLEHPVHNGSSQITPFYWWINTNTNWGEPWYGGFRGSMAEYRLNNQALYDRNFMPNMMGWFSMTAETSLADIEWLMARNAGFDAGFALTADLQTLRNHPNAGALLNAIRTWDTLRMAGAFTEAQRERLRDTDNEFHLEALDDGTHRLYQYELSPTFTHERIIRQPGEPTAAQWTYQSPHEAQPLQFILEATGESGSLREIVFELDNYLRFELPVAVQQGQALVCDGSATLRIYDAQGRQVQKVQLESPPPQVPPGKRNIAFSCQFDGDATLRANVQFKARNAGEVIGASSE